MIPWKEIAEAVRASENELFLPVEYLYRLLELNSADDLARILRGKTVLDLTGGYCGLAIDAYVRAIPATIVSVSPRFFTSPTFAADRLQLMRRLGYLTSQNQTLVETAIALANRLTFPNLDQAQKFTANAHFDLTIGRDFRITSH